MTGPDMAADILAAIKDFEEFTGKPPAHIVMDRTIADELGVEGEPVQMIPEEHDGLIWWRTVFGNPNIGNGSAES